MPVCPEVGTVLAVSRVLLGKVLPIEKVVSALAEVQTVVSEDLAIRS